MAPSGKQLRKNLIFQLKIGHTFLDMARTESEDGNTGAALQSLQQASQAAEAANIILGSLELQPSTLARIRRRISALNKAIRKLEKSQAS